ncbi:hypothetical protein ACFJGW_08770 [Burkholderiaceae bacterium UC74_6]
MKPRNARSSARRQRGVIMVVALVTLVVLLIGAAAMIRSMNSSLSATGSYGFKRDMSNQGARALNYVRNTLMVTGGTLGTDISRQSNLAAENYSATMLATSVEGIPTILLGTDSTFNGSGVSTTGKDITVSDLGITVRYVVDRLCATGTTVPSSSSCMMSSVPSPTGGTCRSASCTRTAPPPQPIYRLTVRVTGPRNAQSFFQSTFSL